MNTKTGPEPTDFDLVNAIIDYETGGLSDQGLLNLFSHLIRTGQAWQLQGHYGRTASMLIEEGFLTSDGEITDKLENLL